MSEPVRALVIHPACTYFRRAGTVVQRAPLMVLLDGEDKPLAFSDREVAILPPERGPHHGGAE